jgi:hypothetical protein
MAPFGIKYPNLAMHIGATLVWVADLFGWSAITSIAIAINSSN